MSRIAAPMLGGMVTAPLLSLFVVPAVYSLLRRRAPSLRRPAESQATDSSAA
jgi:Cu(I)/Ag(I) efflux system membrane protein CusA/SilA